MAQFRRGVVQFALGRGSRVGIFAKGVIKPKRGTSSMPTREVSWLRRTARCGSASLPKVKAALSALNSGGWGCHAEVPAK